MAAFTRLGSSIWDWEPWTELSAIARILWLALYTSAEGRRCAPGLWHGGIPSMADAARMQPDDVRAALDQLLDRDLVEYDPKSRVLRLCALPDAGEFPNNGNCIRSWWTRFRSVPACPVRDAHIRTLRWILDEGGAASGNGVSPNHETAWASTFGTVAQPAPRRRGVRRLADSDTSTQAQPSLFGTSSAHPIPDQPSGNGSPRSGDAGYPQNRSQAVDNSAALHQSNKIRAPETVTGTVTGTNGIPDPGSRIPDFFSSSGEGGGGGGHNPGMRPTLTLVPPYGTAQVIAVLMDSGTYDPRFDDLHQEALCALVQRCSTARIPLDDFVALGELNRINGKVVDASVLLRDPEGLLVRLTQVRGQLRERAARLEMLSEIKAAGKFPA